MVTPPAVAVAATLPVVAVADTPVGPTMVSVDAAAPRMACPAATVGSVAPLVLPAARTAAHVGVGDPSTKTLRARCATRSTDLSPETGTSLRGCG